MNWAISSVKHTLVGWCTTPTSHSSHFVPGRWVGRCPVVIKLTLIWRWAMSLSHAKFNLTLSQKGCIGQSPVPTLHWSVSKQCQCPFRSSILHLTRKVTWPTPCTMLTLISTWATPMSHSRFNITVNQEHELAISSTKLTPIRGSAMPVSINFNWKPGR